MNSNENSHLFDDINKKHEDASFIREQKKRAKEIEKLKKDRLKLEKDILKKIEKASYEKEKEIEKQQKKNKKKSFFARLKEYFKKRKEENKHKKLELKKEEEKKKQEYELRKAKKLELEKAKKAKKEEQRRILEEKKAEKKRLREEEKQRKREEKQLLSSSDNIDLNKPINKTKEDRKLRKQKRLEEKEKRKREKEEAKRLKDEKRKEKIKEEFEEELEDKKEKEKRKLNKISQAIEKKKKINKEREQARKERKEKALLIKKAQEESRAKAKKERKSLEEKLTEWYNNLSFVKDRKNRRELQRQTLLIDFEGSDAERSDEKIMYKYVAKNGETGKVETGMFAAFSKLDVHSFLLAEGYEVYEITPQKNISKTFTLFNAKFTASELDFFLTQLSTFLKSGITLVESIKILSKQCKKKGQQNIYKSLIYELTMGENFSDALQKQGNIFPRLLINMIKTSELTGDLPETLDDMADYYREIEKTRKQMMSALTYPLVVLVFAIAVLVYIMVLVVPQFVDIYGSLGTTLPPITIAILNVSNFLKKNLLMLGIGLLVFIIIFVILFKTIKVFKTVVQTILMNIPIIGKIIIYNEITMFTKTFASLLNHNVYITDCMEVLSKITNNEVYKMLIFDTITNLARGEAISNSFKNHWAFPVIAYEMILTGEKTGQLGPMMDKVADYYQEQHKNAVNQIKAFIEPVMIIILAVIVGVVLLSVVLPMFDMYQQISQT
ncbi:MAG: type II secretion system F family protein [bacterium]|nr:type II secretion system F family protein [bacterium]MDY4108551.1 type II secretion system F family protein [Bacilli bacterium]